MSTENWRLAVAYLEKAKRALSNRGWTQKSIAFQQKALTSVATLKRFWRRIGITWDNFAGICQALGLDPLEVGETDDDHRLRLMDIHALNQDEWVGREHLLVDLVGQVRQSRRILLLLGMAGIGKTALAESVVIRLRGSFDELRENWESDRPRDFVTVAISWLQTWELEVTPELQQNPDLLLAKVLERLTSHPHLLLLDSLEWLLTGGDGQGWGEFQDPYWQRLLVQILAAPTCHSRILITSQHLPTKLEGEADRYGNLWRSVILAGLGSTEQQNFFANFELKDLAGGVDPRLLSISQVYDGHPLALRTIAGEIKELYGGNVGAYWHKNGRYIQEVQQDLAATQDGQVDGEADRWQLDKYTALLRRKVSDQLERIFQQLRQTQPIAYELLCYASIYRCAVTEEAWLRHLRHEDYDELQQELVLMSLGDRCLMERGGCDDQGRLLVGLHSLIRSRATAHRIQLLSNK
jgi:hypothetical protein